MKKKKTNPWIIALIIVLAFFGLLIILALTGFLALMFYITPTSVESGSHDDSTMPREAVRVIYEENPALTACTPTQRNADVCTAEYRPVCGYRDFPENCESPGCSETFSNSCNACSNSEILYYIPGPCRAE